MENINIKEVMKNQKEMIESLNNKYSSLYLGKSMEELVKAVIELDKDNLEISKKDGKLSIPEIIEKTYENSSMILVIKAHIRLFDYIGKDIKVVSGEEVIFDGNVDNACTMIHVCRLISTDEEAEIRG